MKIFQTIKTSTPGTALETIPGLEVPALPEKIAKIDQAGSNDFQAKLGESFMKFREALILALRDPTSLGLGGDTKAAAGLPSLIPISLIQESSTLKVMTSSERNKLAGIETGAQVNTVTSVQGRIGSVVVNASDVGLGDVDNTSDMNKPVSTAQATAINARLPKLTYVGVSMNGASLTASVGKMYGIYATGVTITLPSATSIGDGEVIGFVIGVNASRTLQINTTANQDLVTPDGVKTTGYAVTGFARTVYAVCYFHTWMLCGLEDSAIDDAIAPLAPLASPALTGTPTAPTAAPGTNTTQLATTAFVSGALAGKQNASNAMTTNTTQDVTGTKTYRTSALYYGPATPVNHTPLGFGCGGVAYWGTRQYTNGTLVWQSFPTGGGSARNALGFIFGEDGSVPNLVLYNTPTAPTAAAGTNTTQLATTAFVTGALASKANDADVVKLTGNQSIGGTKTFTTSPVLPTPTAGDNTTKASTTAFVSSAVAGVTASSIGLGSVDNTSDIDKPVSTAQAAAIAACRPKHPYVAITTASTSIAAERGNTYGVNANGCTLTLPKHNTAGYVDGDEISVVLGVTFARTLTITSPSYILRGTGLQPVNTPFNISGYGTFISFTKCSNVWSMSYPEYALDGKAPLASPALTGTPTAPTAAAGTNTTQLASTAFVQIAISGVKQSVPTTKVLTVTADDTVFLETEALDFSVFNKPVDVSFGCRCVGSVDLDLTVELYNPITSTSITLYMEASVPTNPLSIKSTIVKNVGNFDVLTTRLNDGAYAVVLPVNAAVSSARYKIRCICSVGSGGGTVSLFAPEVIITR